MGTIKWLLAAVVLLLVGCQMSTSDMAGTNDKNTQALTDILAQQSAESQARYQWRHPQETLAFFEIEPGMTVVEVLPGGGWYSKILVPYLGENGKLIGADYPWRLWQTFGFMDEQALTKRKTWATDWVSEVEGWGIESGAKVEGTILGKFPAQMHGSADAVLFIRALHNLARYEDKGGYLTASIQGAYRILKPGGIVGVVQHEARADVDNGLAKGDKGYLKRSFVIEQFTQAGFKFVGASEINQNPLDMPGADDVVWRLPPAMYTVKDNAELREKMLAIGESNRMTLKFVKPE